MQRVVFQSRSPKSTILINRTGTGNREVLLAQVIPSHRKISSPAATSCVSPPLYSQDEVSPPNSVHAHMTQIVQHLWESHPFPKNAVAVVPIFDKRAPDPVNGLHAAVVYSPSLRAGHPLPHSISAFSIPDGKPAKPSN